MVKKKQTKTNHSQQKGSGGYHLSSLPVQIAPADIHNKTREQELKEILENVYNRKCIHQLETFNSIPQLGWCDVGDGINLGIKEERERIMKIIDEMIDKNEWGLDDIENCILQELKQKIKGDEK